MTEAQKHAAAVSDPDNPPLTEEDMRRMKTTPSAKITRRALGLTQEEFSERYHIPIGSCATGRRGATTCPEACRLTVHRPVDGAAASAKNLDI